MRIITLLLTLTMVLTNHTHAQQGSDGEVIQLLPGEKLWSGVIVEGRD